MFINKTSRTLLCSLKTKKLYLETKDNWKRLLLDFWKFVNRKKTSNKTTAALLQPADELLLTTTVQLFSTT